MFEGYGPVRMRAITTVSSYWQCILRGRYHIPLIVTVYILTIADLNAIDV